MKLRSVNTKFWDDSFITELDSQQKLLFLYLLTNPLTNLLGIYEISIKRIKFDTGLNNETLQKGLKRFETLRKCFYIDGYIILTNFLKNQSLNPNMKKAVTKAWRGLHEKLRNKIIDNNLIPFQTLPKGLLTLSNPSVTLRKDEDEDEDEYKDENEIKNEYEPKNKYNNIIFSSFNSLKKELINSKEWIDDLCILYKKEPETILIYLNEFLLKQKANDNLYRTFKDIKAHFNNSLAKLYESGKLKDKVSRKKSSLFQKPGKVLLKDGTYGNYTPID